MSDLVRMIDGEGMASSKEIADRFGKPHRDVTKAIRVLECSDEFRERNFSQSSYISRQTKVLDCYDMTRDGFSFLCMGFNGKHAAKWKEQSIVALNALEQHARYTLGDPSLTNAITVAHMRL